MKIVCIGDSISVNALRLMSIEGKVVSSEKELLEKIESTLEQTNCIILIPQRLTLKVSNKLEKLRNRYSASLIVELPDIYGASQRGKNIEKMISSTLGIRL